MSIQNEITRINTNIANAYDAVDTMGGTLPVTQNSANLPDAIATLAQTDYIQLEWIEGTGVQYIDTGITPNDNYIIEMTASNHSNDDTAFFGANTTWSTDTLLCYGVLDRIYFAGTGNNYISHNPTSSTPYTIRVSSSSFTVNGQNSVTESTIGPTNTTLKLFWGGSRIGKFKLYSTKVWNGNTLVGDYTPVIKKSDGEAGLYDNVSKTFFGNSGTGKFNTNNHDGYIQLEWVESTGSQYINTGINANTVGKIQTKFKSVNANNSTWRSVLYCEDPGGSYPGLGIRINDSNKLQFNYCSAYIPISTTVTPDSSEAANTWYETELDGLNNRVIINNTTYNNTFSGSLPDGNIYVFAIEYESAASQYSSMRISYLKIYNLSNELVRDFIPVLRTTDYEVGLYDKVNNQFYGNSGLGFLRPGIKIAGYNIVDNIQSSGSAYFDTGVSGGNKMEYALYLNTMGSKARNYEQYFAGDLSPVSHKLYLETYNNRNAILARGSSGTVTLYNNASAKHTISFYNDGKIYLDTTLKGTLANNGWGTLSYYVFNSHSEPTLISSMAVFQLVMKTDGNVVRFYIPTKRASDNKYGFYDLVNNTFSPSASNTAFTAGSVSISNDGTNSPYYYTPVVVPTPSTKSGSIANQIDRINENIANAYDVCRQIGRTMPSNMNSVNLEPTILDSTLYTVTWQNYDGTILETDHYFSGETPVYDGINPTKPGDSTYTYTFDGWSPAVTTVTQNIIYTAQYSSSYVNYTITWKNHDNTVITSNTYHYGDTPVYSGATPLRTSTSTTFYTFSGWSPTVTTVTQDKVYTAQYSSGTYSTELYYENTNINHILELFPAQFPYAPPYRGTDGSIALNSTGVNDILWRYHGGVFKASSQVKIEFLQGTYVSDNIVKPKSCNCWFRDFSAVTEILNLDHFNTAGVTNMVYMFAFCRSITHLDLTTFITNNVTNMSSMFEGCTSLTYLDLSSFDMSNVSNTTDMFEGCTKVTTAYCRTRADKAILDAACQQSGVNWRFTVKS